MNEHPKPITFVAPEPEHLAPFFPGYDIEHLIATGGMGAVYRAIQKSLDRAVAIKILPREFSRDAAFCAGFEAEAKAMARLNHPNLIGVFDFGEVEGMLYIIMEYVHGQSLYHASHGIAIDPGEVIRLMTGICNGLAHAHENGIIHRDIKPSNILLDLNAQPKIGDFGLARPIEHKLADGEEIYGTPHYTAPEVLNSPNSVGYRADIFSVGVMLHELLTGHLPAEDRRLASAIARCDHRFDAIIRRATSPLPANRYLNALEIVKDLNVIAASSAPKAVRPTAQKGPARPVASPPRTAPARTATARKTVRIQKKKSSPLPGIVMLVLAIGIIIYGCVNFADKLKPSLPKLQVTDKEVPRKESFPTPVAETSSRPRAQENLTTRFESSADRETRHESHPAPYPVTSELAEPVPLSKNSLEASSLGSATPPSPPQDLQPKFDVPTFLDKARKIMKDKAKPAIVKHNESLVKNIDDYGKAIKRFIWRMENGKPRLKAESSLEDYVRFCKDHENRIPAEISRSDIQNRAVQDLENFETLRDEYVEKEKSIDALFQQSFAQLSATYILGLEKQIERLNSSDDPAAVSLIEAEIDKSRNSESYFPDLMLDGDMPTGAAMR